MWNNCLHVIIISLYVFPNHVQAKSKDTYNSFSIPYKLSYNVYIILVWNWIGVMESEHESVKGQVPAMGPIHIAPKVCTKNQLITKCDADNILQLHHRCIPGTEDDYYCNCVCLTAMEVLAKLLDLNHLTFVIVINHCNKWDNLSHK